MLAVFQALEARIEVRLLQRLRCRQAVHRHHAAAACAIDALPLVQPDDAPLGLAGDRIDEDLAQVAAGARESSFGNLSRARLRRV
jgi:hypothetical protein